MKTTSKPETKKVKDNFFTRVQGTNAWFQSTEDGRPILNSGEVEMATKAAKQAPEGYEIQVTIGPYRCHDLAGSINVKEKIINIDLYSVRPGGDYELSETMKKAKQIVDNAQP